MIDLFFVTFAFSRFFKNIATVINLNSIETVKEKCIFSNW